MVGDGRYSCSEESEERKPNMKGLCGSEYAAVEPGDKVYSSSDDGLGDDGTSKASRSSLIFRDNQERDLASCL